MTDVAVRAAYSSSIDYGNKVEDGAFSFVTQLNNRTKFNAVQLPSVEVPSYTLERGSSEQLFKSAVQWLSDNGYIEDNDLVIFGHGTADFGFGDSHRVYVDGNKVNGGISYADFLASPLLAEIFAIHELAHGPFEVTHDDGNVQTNSNDYITTVTPMAAAYTKANGNCDTEVCGSGPAACGSDDPPASFCDQNGDRYYNGTADGFASCPIHTTSLSECAIDEIDNTSYSSPR